MYPWLLLSFEPLRNEVMNHSNPRKSEGLNAFLSQNETGVHRTLMQYRAMG
jgi:hypothetical protein